MGSSICSLAVLLLQAASPTHRVEGQVLRPGGEQMVPVAGVWATLHRVGPDSSGPLDSVRTDGRGRYSFAYSRHGSPEAVYFVSALYGGVAYFTAPLAPAAVSGDAADVVVFDTTSRGVPIVVRGRHIIVSRATGGARSVTEVYELSNDTSLALVSPAPGASPTFTALIPAAARDPRVTQGDVPADAVSFSDGLVRVVSPMPPGVKQLVYTYSAPASAFPLSVPTRSRTDVYEVLIEDSRGVARGARFAEVPSVTIDGKAFRRFLAQDVPASAVAVIDLPAPRALWSPKFLALFTVVIGGSMILALARTYRRR